MLRTIRFPLVAVLLLGLLASCDFGAAENAIDEFDVIVGLPALSAVVNLQALDASDGSPISQEVQVVFDGQDESSVVDIYSDPLSEMTVEGGFANFALDSTRSPSSENPARLTLRAQAEGYNATSVSVQITEEGSVNRVIRLTPDNPEQSSEGTAGSRETVNTDDNGETTTAVTAETGETSTGPDAAQGSASIPAGTSLQTAGGEPLQGQVTTDLSVFDNSAEAQELMPPEAKETENGRRQIRGAARFEVQDESGRTASQFGGGGGDTTTVTADLPTINSDNGTPSITFVNPSTGESRTVELASSTSSQKRSAGKRAQEATIIQFIEGDAFVIPTVGEPIDVPNLAEDLSGEIFLGVGVEPSQNCEPQGELDIAPNGQSGSLAVSVSGEGFATSTEVSIPGSESSFTLSAASLFSGTIPDAGPATVTLQTSDGQEVSTEIDLCAGSASVDLPAPTSDRISASVRVVPDCPQGERLPVSPPFDGYSVSYRQSGNSGRYQTVPKENITINTTDDDLETVTSAVVPVSGVLPNTDYEFVGTFGEESSSQVVTMPGQDGAEVVVTDQELRGECQ
jgi:hypothetical protein